MSNSALWWAWVCGNCGWHTMEKYAPPQCPRCTQQALENRALPREGKVHSWTTVYDAPEGFGLFAPYCIGIIALPITLRDGRVYELLLTARLAEPCETGDFVEEVVGKIYDNGRDLVMYGPEFRPKLRWERK